MASTLFLTILLPFLVQVSCQSLTFVVDDTGSSYEEMHALKETAKSIVDLFLKEQRPIEIQDMVLVTFNDPETQLRIKTHNVSEYKQALDSIQAHGGDDCPDMALSGIIRGLEESKPGSYLFVFTDASAKDYRRLDEITTLCHSKQSKIFIILTGSCDTTLAEEASNQVYQKIACGLVIPIQKKEIKKLPEYIMDIIRPNIPYTMVSYKFVPANEQYEVNFNMDGNYNQTDFVLVGAYGSGVILSVLDQGLPLKHDIMHIQWTDDVKIIEVENLKTSTYTARVKGNSQVILQIIKHKKHITENKPITGADEAEVKPAE